MVSSQIICTNKPLWLGWMVVIFQALVGCHDILILGKSPIKWRQRPDMTLAVDWDVKHQLKQVWYSKYSAIRCGKYDEIQYCKYYAIRLAL